MIQNLIHQYQYNKAEWNLIKSKVVSQDPIHLCPFRLESGAIVQTSTGYKGLNSIVNDYSQYSLIITGKETATIVWDNSVKITQNAINISQKPPYKQSDAIDPLKNNIEKKFQVGDVIKAKLMSNIQTQQQNTFLPQADEQMMFNTRNFSVLIERDKFNDDALENFFLDNGPAYEFKFFLAPQIDKEIIINKTFPINTNITRWNRQIFRPWKISWYTAGTNKKIGAMIHFESVNDLFSGLSLIIQQLISFGSVGAPYSLPIYDEENKKITLNENTLKFNGVTHAQVSFYGNHATMGIQFLGYESNVRKNKDNSYTETITALDEICFDDQWQSALYDNPKFTALPIEHYKFLDMNPVIDEAYKEWQDFIGSKTFDPFYEKHYEGHLTYNNSIAAKSQGQTPGDNPSKNIGNYLYKWNDPSFLKNSIIENNFVGAFDNIYFSKNDKGKIKGFEISKIDDRATYGSNLKYGSLSNFLSFNMELYANCDQIPTNIRCSLPISTSFNVGSVIGKVAGIVAPEASFFGFFTQFINVTIPLGFRIWQKGINFGQFNTYNCLIDATTMDTLGSLFPATSKGKNILPTDALRYGTKDATLALTGQKNNLTAFCGSISNCKLLGIFKDSDNSHLGYTNSYNFDGSQDEIDLPTHFSGQKIKCNLIEKTGELAPDGVSKLYILQIIDNGLETVNLHTLPAPNNKTIPTLMNYKYKNRKSDKSFVLTGIKFKGIGKTDYRLTFFKNNSVDPIEQEVFDNNMIWQGYFKTFSKEADNCWLISNSITFGSPFYDLKKTFIFPEAIASGSEGIYSERIPLNNMEQTGINILDTNIFTNHPIKGDAFGLPCSFYEFLNNEVFSHNIRIPIEPNHKVNKIEISTGGNFKVNIYGSMQSEQIAESLTYNETLNFINKNQLSYLINNGDFIDIPLEIVITKSWFLPPPVNEYGDVYFGFKGYLRIKFDKINNNIIFTFNWQKTKYIPSDQSGIDTNWNINEYNSLIYGKYSSQYGQSGDNIIAGNINLKIDISQLVLTAFYSKTI